MSQGFSAGRIVVDLGLSLGLLGALGLVYLHETRSPTPNPGAGLAATDGQAPPADSKPTGPGAATTTKEKVIVPEVVTRTLKLAVVDPPAFDDVAQLLTGMGEGYRDFDRIGWDQLLDPEKRKVYDVVFLTCGAPKDSAPSSPDRVVEALRDLAESGKTLYVSDLWYPFVVGAFPEAFDPDASGKPWKEVVGRAVDNRSNYGDKQDIQAEVVDPSLREMLGDRLPLRFDAPGWAPAIFNGGKVTPLLQGRYRTINGSSRTEPLLVKFPAGNGTVIFTSFHNSKLIDEDGRKLLKGLVLVVATSRVERELYQTAVSGGLSPRHGGLLKASRGGEPARMTYQNRRRGRLKFILGFEPGAELKLEVRGPDGTSRQAQGTAGVEIEIADAAQGEWSYTISAIRVPFDDFGYRLLIAE